MSESSFSTWATFAVSFATDFILTAGGTISGGMLGQQTVSMPSTPVWVLAAVLGIMAGARRIQALMSVPPGPQVPVTVTTTTAPTPGLPLLPTTVTKTERTPGEPIERGSITP
jgi:hypothetical protein